MVSDKTYSESGFTLVELLLVSVIIVVLAGLSVQAYIIHKENAYHAVAMQMMKQARNALEGGKVDSESFPQQVMSAEQTAPGPVIAGDGGQLVPGLVLPESFHVLVRHNPVCADDACIEDAIICRHCKSKRQVQYIRTHKLGEIIHFNAAAGGSC